MKIYWEGKKLIVDCEEQRMYAHPSNPLEKLPKTRNIIIINGTFDAGYRNAGMSTIDLYKMVKKEWFSEISRLKRKISNIFSRRERETFDEEMLRRLRNDRTKTVER